MPRRARMYLPELTYHIVQRGNNREACFIEPENYQFYLELWKEISKRYGVLVHSYCLMTNHIHFLVTPTTDTSISNTMSKRGRRDFKLTSCEKVAYLVSPATKKARELLCRDVQGYTCQSYPTISFKEAIIEKPAS